MKFSELVFDAKKLFLPIDPVIKNITSKSSLCENGFIFVCISGLHRDGHLFIDEVISKGASAIIIDSLHLDLENYLVSLGIPFAVYDDTRSAEAFVFSRFYGDPWKKMKIFAVTGTNGKTTVVSLLDSVYKTAGFSSKTIGTLTGNMTTPDPEILYKSLADFSNNGVQYVFMEASSHALELGKLAPIKFDFGIFTNLTPEHLDFHKTMQKYAEAKSKLFSMSEKSIINADDCYSNIMQKNSAGKCYLCSAKHDGYDFFVRNTISKGIFGIKYDILTTDLVLKVNSVIPGMFNVMNTLEAAAAAIIDGIPPNLVRIAVCGFCGVKGRLERVRIPTNDFSVYIDFAHTPDALENILNTVRSFIGEGQRIVLVFGCGGDRDKQKRSKMGAIATRLADFVIITSDNSRSENTLNIIDNILEGVSSSGTYTVIENRKEAIEYAIETALPGDVILLAGKGHEEYEIRSDGIHPFSEKEIVQKASEKYIKSRGMY